MLILYFQNLPGVFWSGVYGSNAQDFSSTCLLFVLFKKKKKSFLQLSVSKNSTFYLVKISFY